MKDKIISALIIVIAALSLIIGILCASLKQKTNIVDTYKANTEALSVELERGKIRDSLTTSKVVALRLTIEELERLRAEDAQLINDLKISKKELAGLVKMQSQTIQEIEGKLKDSIAIRIVDSVAIKYDSIRVMSYHDKYLDMDFKLNKDGSFDGKVETRDNITAVEEVEYKRFLGFLWRTKRVKSSSVTAFSDNPHTLITSVEYIVMRK